ncbi:hypothetical protein FD723_40495 (plasmid) [Nostoc sp. C052]|uniref:hypothetical protein n=1 Tax=Nostoc sp. C052 TaxID=2576902 RepID=UPI0015C39DB6|nr:hypothetical protein [Nostoc sp. C052]QLE46494.1 hypothetical protein FD723_40495 [Nostoc sp. C052]
MKLIYRFSAIAHPEGLGLIISSVTENGIPISLDELHPIVRKFFCLEPESHLAKLLTLDMLKPLLRDGMYQFHVQKYDQIIHSRIGNLLIWEESINNWHIGIEEAGEGSIYLNSIITKLSSWEDAQKFASCLRRGENSERYKFYENPTDEVATTDPYGKLEWSIGDDNDFICFDCTSLPCRQVAIHAVTNCETASFIEDFDYLIVSGDQAIAVAQDLIAQATNWCLENDVNFSSNEAHSFVEYVQQVTLVMP